MAGNPPFTVGKSGYLISTTDQQIAEVFPVRLLSPEEVAADKAETERWNREYTEGIHARLALAHPALQPIIKLHSPDQYQWCNGCDPGDYAESSPHWPCSTIDLILDSLPPHEEAGRGVTS
jgi:hypothetical protein